MVSTNLALAKHLDGRPLSESEIKVGLLVDFPSSCGGSLTHECIDLTGDEAKFQSTNKNWPGSTVIKFNQPDFELSDFELLSEALKAFSNTLSIPNDEQRAIVRRGHELGYAVSISYTQAHWTDRGIETYNAAK